MRVAHPSGLRSQVSGINIGPVFKKDVMRCATMLEKAKELACILCFDVVVDKEAEKLAEELGVRLFKGAFDAHLPCRPSKCVLTYPCALLRNSCPCSQPTSSTTCSTHSRPTTRRSWKPSVKTQRQQPSGRADSRSLPHLRNVIRSLSAVILLMETCMWEHRFV